MKYEWRKSEKGLYGAKQKPELVEVPSQQFIVIEGEGNPNEADFSERVAALYSLAYSIKMLFKSMMKDEAEDKMTNLRFILWKVSGKKLLGKASIEVSCAINS